MNAIATTLSPDVVETLSAPVAATNRAFAGRYPGETGARQPVHTVYGGAHLFKADTARKLGNNAVKAFEEYAPDPATLAEILGLPTAGESATDSPIAAFNVAYDDTPLPRSGPSWLSHAIHARVLHKLRHEPVEDLRIDFEDGYGARSDEEEDGHAVAAASEVAEGMIQRSLPPFLGIRVKALSEETRRRSVRTLDVFLTALGRETRGQVPPGFVITLPKITVPEQVSALADLLDALEPKLGIAAGALGIELMVEAPQTLLGPGGELWLSRLGDLARGRCVAAHFGAYDYTAAVGVSSTSQTLTHSSCDFARHLMQLAFAQTKVRLSDGATNLLPIPPHRAPMGGRLSEREILHNHEVVRRAFRVHYEHVRRALDHGFYQGWDLHPAQLPIRYAAVYAFFLEGLDAAAERLSNFIDKAARATLVRDVFDDAATGQGLFNFFLRAINAGAITEAEAVEKTTLSLKEIRGRSFLKIVEGRRGK